MAIEKEHLTVLLCNKFFVPVGGAETVMFEELRMLESNGHTVVPFAMRRQGNVPSPYSKYFVSGVDYAKPNAKGLIGSIRDAGNIIYSHEAARKIRDLAKSTHPDIAHLHNIYHQISPSICNSLKREKIPMVMTLHDLKLLCANYLCYRNGNVCEACAGKKFYNVVRYKCVKNSRMKSLVCCVEMYVHRLLKLYENIDMFIAPSEFLKEKILQYGRLPKDRIVHVPNAINVKAFTPTYSNEGYCLFIGRLTEYKGIMTLMAAMCENRNVKLRVVGIGDAKWKAERFKQSHSLDNVEFEGFKTGEELRSLIQGASFVIVPSECYENCPMVVLEAFACGKPVIGSQLGGIPEIIEDGVSGLLFDAGNAADLAEKISLMARWPKLRMNMGKEARARAEKKYTPEKHFESLMQVYQSVIEQSVIKHEQ